MKKLLLPFVAIAAVAGALAVAGLPDIRRYLRMRDM
jgi:hypothetical protein